LRRRAKFGDLRISFWNDHPRSTKEGGPAEEAHSREPRFRSVQGALNRVDGYEAMHMIREVQARWLAKGDVLSQRAFINPLFGIAV
jgi:hypothetical protein